MRFLREINNMAQKNKGRLLTAIKKLKNKKVRFRRKCNNYSSPLRLELVRYLQSVFQSSTTHGLPYIVNNRLHYLEKAFWIVNVVVCFTIMIALLTLQYFRFVAAPTVMSVERNYFDWNISYPTITLCPLYKPDGIKLGKFINDTNEKSGLNVKAYVWAIAQAALDTIDFIDLDPPDEQQLIIDPKDYAEVAATLFRNFDKDWLATKGDQAISVDAAMTEMGMCHVINSNVAIFDQPHNWNTAAIAAETYVKKNIDLSIFEADFFTVITNYESVYKVFIHGPDEVTMTTGSSFIFDVEGLISFGLSVWSTRISEELRYKSLRLRKCSTPLSNVNRFVFEKLSLNKAEAIIIYRFTHEPISKRYPVYSFNHCILECRIKMILKICGCIPHFYKPLNNERICYISELKCILKHRKEIITLKTSEETLKNFCNTKDLPKISRDCGCLNSCELDLYYKDDEDFLPQKGLNKLKIKITSFPKVRVVRDVIFSFYDIVLKSGGVMNLCIGSSLISLVELILVIVKCIISFKLYLDQFIEI